MAEFNNKERTLNVKIVYYGPAVGGKTTNLRLLHSAALEERRGEMISLNSLQDRTVLFDMMPLRLRAGHGIDVKLQLVAVPGQPMYTATRRMALKGADGMVFVANSASDRWYENVASLDEMRRYLVEHHLDPEGIPLVFQYNKRDLPEISDVEGMDRALNSRGSEAFPAIAVSGRGVLETFRAILAQTAADLQRRFPRLDLFSGLAPAEWAEVALKTAFGTSSLVATNGELPGGTLARRRIVRVSTTDSGTADAASVEEVYAEACAQLSTSLVEAQATVDRVEGWLEDVRRATRMAGEAPDFERLARSVLSCLGEACGAAHASLAMVEGAGLRGLTLPPLDRDPLLASADGREHVRLSMERQQAHVLHASESPELAASLEGFPALGAVVAVPIRSAGRAVGLGLLYMLRDDRMPDAHALRHLDDLAAILSSPLGSRRPQVRPVATDAALQDRVELGVPTRIPQVSLRVAV